ncbi:MAG: acyltransferase, partial [Phycisphaerales bacterium]|nr:acyltransferase [Phycisphaerales bacterium]
LLPDDSKLHIISTSSLGHFGVILFFVLSGFLITRILISAKGKKNAYKNFLIRRSLRIFPIYFLVILILLFIEPGRYLAECAAYISNYTFAFNDNPNPMRHTWSLCVEEHFYIIWPPIVLFLTMRVSKVCAFVGFPLISIIGAFVVYKYFPDHADALFYRGTNFQVFSLSLGSALAYSEPWLRAHWKRTLLVGGAFLIAGVGVAGLLKVLNAPNFTLKFYGFSIVSAGIVCVFLAINDKGGRLCELLSNPMTSYIGRISYGLYLYHYPVYYYFGIIDKENLVAGNITAGDIALATVITFAISIASFHLFEKPLLRFKSRFT